MHPRQTLAYRADIDGLRAIAVSSVVIYHFGLGWLGGGFVGVDIFFVISGFLITGIIAKELAEGRFSFAAFYERRARRLFPALFVMCTAVLAIGWWVLLPSDLKRLGMATIATILFGANVHYWRNSGYFDDSADFNPLLHTWSLGVEEQFYFAFPLLLIVAARYFPRSLRGLLWVGVVASFVACVLVQSYRPTATFFLLPFRAWELGVGALLAMDAVPRLRSALTRELLAWSGLLAIGVSVLVIPPGPTFPGWQAALPVLGTAAVIHAGSSGETRLSSLLSSKPMAFIGMLSYSWYLWHWPVAVYANYLSGFVLPTWAGAVLVPFSLMLAYLSYRWVETPFRASGRTLWRSFRLERKGVFCAAAVSMSAIVLLGFAVNLRDGWPSRMPAEEVAVDALRSNELPYLQCVGAPTEIAARPDCRLGSATATPSFVLWGDSHALAIAPGIDLSLRRLGASGVALVTPGCPSLLGLINPNHSRCNSINAGVLEFLKVHPEIRTVVLHSYWLSYLENEEFYSASTNVPLDASSHLGLIPRLHAATIAQVQALGRAVVLIGPVPESPVAPIDYLFHVRNGVALPRSLARDEFARLRSRYDATMREPFVQGPSPVHIIEPASWLCPESACLYTSAAGLLYRDHDHLSPEGARQSARFIEPALRAAAGASMRVGAEQVSAAR